MNCVECKSLLRQTSWR